MTQDDVIFYEILVPARTSVPVKLSFSLFNIAVGFCEKHDTFIKGNICFLSY